MNMFEINKIPCHKGGWNPVRVGDSITGTKDFFNAFDSPSFPSGDSVL